jgi:hypothetical protein
MRFAIPLTTALATLSLFAAAFGQSREITASELTNLKTISTEKQKGLPRREKVTTTGYGPSDRLESLLEFGPDDTYHYVIVRKANGVETRDEGIHIGFVRYKRQQDGGWVKQPLARGLGGVGSGSGDGSGYGGGTGTGPGSAPPEITETHLYLGTERIDGRKAAHYRKERIIKFRARTDGLVRKVVNEYWFRDDGLLVKSMDEDVLENARSAYRRVVEFQYDKNIRIKAPIPE